MAESQGQIPFVEYDADGRIDQDLPCLECGYNLRTLLDDGQCPECGTSFAELARIGWLFQCDPDWLRRLARSMIWIGVTMVCFVLYLSFDLLSFIVSRPPAGYPTGQNVAHIPDHRRQDQSVGQSFVGDDPNGSVLLPEMTGHP